MKKKAKEAIKKNVREYIEEYGMDSWKALQYPEVRATENIPEDDIVDGDTNYHVEQAVHDAIGEVEIMIEEIPLVCVDSAEDCYFWQKIIELSDYVVECEYDLADFRTTDEMCFLIDEADEKIKKEIEKLVEKWRKK